MAAEQRLPPAATQRCAVLPFSVAKATGVRLHPAHTPCRWHEHQFSSEWWMDRWMAEKVSPPAGRDPDLVYLTDHSFSLWCHRQQAVVKDHLVSAEPETRLKAPAPRILLYLPYVSPMSHQHLPYISRRAPASRVLLRTAASHGRTARYPGWAAMAASRSRSYPNGSYRAGRTSRRSCGGG